MSLESQVATLVAAAGNNLLLPGQIAQTAIEQIAKVSQAYQTAIATADIARYVDQVLGNDATNDGKTAGAPFKTIDRAIADCTPGGLVTVTLLSNYLLDKNINILNKRVRVATANNATRRTIATQKYSDPATNTRCCYRFAMSGDSTLSLLSMDLQLPNTDGFTALARDFRSALIGPPDQLADSIFTRQAVGLLSCDFAIPSNNLGAIVSGIMMHLYVANCTTSISPLAGRLVEKYQNTAGTAAVNVTDVFTNLTTL
jgi:hypothetical protein